MKEKNKLETREDGQLVVDSSPYTIQTFTGKLFNLLEPRSEDVDIWNIIIPLSQMNRWNCNIQWTVLQHSLLCELICRRFGGDEKQRLALLSHDFHEGYTGDSSRPFKQALHKENVLLNGQKSMNALDLIEFKIQRAIHEKLLIFPYRPFHILDCIAPIDNLVLKLEWEVFMNKISPSKLFSTLNLGDKNLDMDLPECKPMKDYSRISSIHAFELLNNIRNIQQPILYFMQLFDYLITETTKDREDGVVGAFNSFIPKGLPFQFPWES